MLEDKLRHVQGLAILDIPLADNIPADLLAKLLGPLGTLYFYETWLDLAAASTAPGPFPDEHPLGVTETLWISRLEIGTPNKLRLLGRQKHILAIAAVLVAVLAVPKSAVDIVSGVENAIRARAEYHRIVVETDLKRLEVQEKQLDILKKALDLYKAGRISEAALEHKTKEYPQLLEALKQAALVIPDDKVITVSDLK